MYVTEIKCLDPNGSCFGYLICTGVRMLEFFSSVARSQLSPLDQVHCTQGLKTWKVNSTQTVMYLCLGERWSSLQLPQQRTVFMSQTCHGFSQWCCFIPTAGKFYFSSGREGSLWEVGVCRAGGLMKPSLAFHAVDYQLKQVFRLENPFNARERMACACWLVYLGKGNSHLVSLSLSLCLSLRKCQRSWRSSSVLT